MGLAYDVKTEDAQRVASVELPNCDYVLPDGSHAPAAVDVVWCSDCDDFSSGERIPVMATLKQLLADTYANRMPDYLTELTNCDEADRQQLITLTEKQIEWLSLRNDRPKCLKCGSTEIRKLPDDHTYFPHPKSGESITVSVVLGLSKTDHRSRLLDVNGNKLR